MYAVIKTGGKQYRVAEGATLKVERLDAAEGDAVEFDQVLLVGEGEKVTIGTPLVEGGKARARPRRWKWSSSIGARITGARRATASSSPRSESRKSPPDNG